MYSFLVDNFLTGAILLVIACILMIASKDIRDSGGVRNPTFGAGMLCLILLLISFSTFALSFMCLVTWYESYIR